MPPHPYQLMRHSRPRMAMDAGVSRRDSTDGSPSELLRHPLRGVFYAPQLADTLMLAASPC